MEMDNLILFLESKFDLNNLKTREIYSYYDFPRFFSFAEVDPNIYPLRYFLVLSTDDFVETNLPERSVEDPNVILKDGLYLYASWVMAELSFEKLLDFENCRITMIEAFSEDNSIGLWRIDETSLGEIISYKIESAEFENLKKNNQLPTPGIYLNGETK